MKKILIKKQIYYIVIVLLFSIAAESKAQVENNFCIASEETYYSKIKIEMYFADKLKEKQRIISNTNNIPFSEVSIVNNNLDCIRLHNYLSTNSKYIEKNLNGELMIFYYQSNNFYYIFWLKKILGPGSEELFFVVKKDFSETFEFYF